ncbi:RNI-like protein [Rhizoclosmatium globosum]|uniref:RNI-like protein n=1 Tax=Rhizoclosmatium globosum TaxID=329046 RepID=A0A1Y2C2N1_9FUNG|nr:RNI-like protein [Rhizoclosmatium globosum]|eukprot:ORY41279.1 RNI-like protein [Rhizoclosmatium globosum]
MKQLLDLPPIVLLRIFSYIPLYKLRHLARIHSRLFGCLTSAAFAELHILVHGIPEVVTVRGKQHYCTHLAVTASDEVLSMNHIVWSHLPVLTSFRYPLHFQEAYVNLCLRNANPSNSLLSTASNLPPTIGCLGPHLKEIQVYGGQVKGEIPTSIYRLTSLEHCDLHGNRLGGRIPEEIGSLFSLRSLDLSSCMLLGPLPAWTPPPQLASLSSLRFLNLSGNHIRGGLTAEVVGNWREMEHLNLSTNRFVVGFPEIVGTSLLSINLSHNELTGSIPEEIGELVNLERLDLSHNQLTGVIPPSIAKCSKLTHIYLCGNRLEGDIPAAIGELSRVKIIDLSRNVLGGTIAKEVGNVLTLEELNLSMNKLEGTIPEELDN